MVLSSLDERKHLPHQLRILVTFFLCKQRQCNLLSFFLEIWSEYFTSILNLGANNAQSK